MNVLQNHVRPCKSWLLYAGRVWPRGLQPIRPATTSVRLTSTTAAPPRLSVLPLVHSAINLALPSGPFTNPATTHRASCTSQSIQPDKEEQLLPVFLHSTSLSNPIGFLRPKVVDEIRKDHIESGKNSTWNVLCTPDDSPWAVCFADHIADLETRTRTLHVVMERWKSEGLFPDVLKGWSNETYPVYTPRQERTESTSNVAFGIERAALPLFGFANFGCLLTAFYDCPVSNRTMLWIPRRSPTKKTWVRPVVFHSSYDCFEHRWPGRYDCTVGGGIGLGETPNNAIVRECTEEACLPSHLVRKSMRSAGMINFANRSPSKWILPGIYYLYELRLPNDGTIVPHTNDEDGEVDAFHLMDVDELLQRLLQGQFKPSSAMALVDFCIRRGFITPESEPNYLDVCVAMRRPVVLPLP